MGALLSCFSEEEVRRRAPPPRRRSSGPGSHASAAAAAGAAAIGSSNRWSKVRSGKKERGEEALIQEQALAAALLLQQSGVQLPFDRSSSLRYPAPPGVKKQGLPRSSSSRARSLTDPPVQPQQLVNQDLKVDDLETSHFVLVHGGGFGAWCWYKTIALLEECGFKVTAIDLTGSGVHSFDTNNITSLSQYVKPLTDFLEKLVDGEKVILVGHDFGGACISYAMEIFSSKIAKAVFISAAMLQSGQSTLDMFSQKEVTDDLMRQAQVFIYANGSDRPPTAIDLNKSLLKELMFNQCPGKDVALASVSMRPIPFAPVLEKLTLSDSGYGSVRRFYIETAEDNAIPPSLQQAMCDANPPEHVFRLKGSDHSPFFSKPQALHKLLVEISTAPNTKSSVTVNGMEKPGRGVSSGGGQSSLGYLFGSGEAPKPTPSADNGSPVQKQRAPSPVDKQTPAGIQGNSVNNYFRADGPNSGNFITDRPSTKVHSAPGGGSSLGYLFGGGGN